MKEVIEDCLEDVIVATRYGDAQKDDEKSVKSMNQSWKEKKDDKNLDNKKYSLSVYK